MFPKRKDYLFVGIQGIFFLLYLFKTEWPFPTLPDFVSIIGLGLGVIGCLVMIIALFQLGPSLSPFPTPKAKAQLVQHGLYKWVRHPIYTGIIIATLGLGIYTAQLSRVLLSAALWMLFYWKASYEEQLLAQKYKDYESYQRKTGMLFPRIV